MRQGVPPVKGADVKHLLDPNERTINAKFLLDLLQAAVADYAKQLETDAHHR